MKIPQIHEVMTRQPYTIDLNAPLQEAAHIMWKQNIRHLPVLEEGNIVGIVSDRDIHMAETLAEGGGMKMELIMTPVPYAVHPSTPIDEVAATMVEHKYGSAIVVEENKVLGIFTTIDAMSLLARMYREKQG